MINTKCLINSIFEKYHYNNITNILLDYELSYKRTNNLTSISKKKMTDMAFDIIKLDKSKTKIKKNLAHTNEKQDQNALAILSLKNVHIFTY